HHRMAIRSFSRCASMSFGVTFGLSDACGIFLLSNLNSQKPDRSGRGVFVCASKAPKRIASNFIVVAPAGRSTAAVRDRSNHTILRERKHRQETCSQPT